MPINSNPSQLVEITWNGTTKQLLDVKSTTLNFKRNEPLTWSITLDNSYGQYSPYKSSVWNGWLSPDIYTNGAINKILHVTLSPLTGISRTTGDLVLLSKRSSVDADGNPTIVLSGIDRSQLLLKRNQTLQGYKSTQSTVYYSKQIMTDILNTSKWTSGYTMDFPDNPILQLEIQNEILLDVIKQILAKTGAEWFVNWDNTLVMRQPIYKPTGLADWTYGLGSNIFLIDESEEVVDLINVVQIGKSTPMGGAENIFEWDEPGRQTINFDPPIKITGIKDLSTGGGTIGFCDFFTVDPVNGVSYSEGYQFHHADPPGNVFGSSSPGGSSFPPIPANYLGMSSYYTSRLDLTTFLSGVEGISSSSFPGYNPNSIYKGYKVNEHWKLQIFGMKESSLPSNFIDSDFNILVKNDMSILKYGEYWLPNSPSLGLIATKQEAIDLATRILQENGRTLQTLTFKVPLNLYLEIGQTIRIVESINNVDSYFYVENFTHNFSDSDISTNIVVSRYIQ